jgi:threonine aldolase
MLEAMVKAKVGNAAYGEDPTVNQLQNHAAELLGMEAAIYLPSGTMGNQIAIKTHVHHGEEVILEATSHIFHKEIGAMAAFAGAMPRPIPTKRGAIPIQAVEAAIRPPSNKEAQTGLICLENTHNRQGGAVYPLGEAQDIIGLAHSCKIPVHLDGARIFNASIAAKTPVKELARGFDSVMFCLSKGLGAPIGSMLVGSRDFIARAQRFQKMFGGAMRQAGVIAAAGLYALVNNIERLCEDHENAHLLARGLLELENVEVVPIETNIVIFSLAEMSAERFTELTKEAGVLVNPISERSIRLVTHLDTSREQVLEAVDVIGEVLGG